MVRGGRVTGDQVGYGFCLGEVQFSVQEGALGEFARLGQPLPLVTEKA